MLCLSQLYCNGWRQTRLCSMVSVFKTTSTLLYKAEYPDKFTCGFVVQPLYMDHALNEIERCVKLGIKSTLFAYPFFKCQMSEWLSTAESDVDPIYELANKYGLAVQIHPYDGEKMIALKNQYWRFHLVWMMAQCADTLHLFTLTRLAQ